MLLLAILTLILAGLAVALIVRGIALPGARASSRVEQIGAYGYAPPSAAPAKSDRTSIVAGLARSSGEFMASRLGGYETWLKDRLVAAGIYGLVARTLIGYQFIVLIVLTGLVVATFAEQGAGVIVWVLLCAAVVMGLPALLLRNRARSRVEAVDRGVPDLIDMLVVTIEAGLGFSASLQTASTRIEGPLGDELRLTMQQQRMGIALRESLTHLASRVEGPAMRSFVRSVTQGEALGVSIGTVMRNLAREMRVRRRQVAEERAQKAPVKMLFPLVFLMFPSLGIVILGPAIIEITQKLGG